jgi:hypothetical protein
MHIHSVMIVLRQRPIGTHSGQYLPRLVVRTLKLSHWRPPTVENMDTLPVRDVTRKVPIEICMRDEQSRPNTSRFSNDVKYHAPGTCCKREPVSQMCYHDLTLVRGHTRVYHRLGGHILFLPDSSQYLQHIICCACPPLSFRSQNGTKCGADPVGL